MSLSSPFLRFRFISHSQPVPRKMPSPRCNNSSVPRSATSRAARNSPLLATIPPHQTVILRLLRRASHSIMPRFLSISVTIAT